MYVTDQDNIETFIKLTVMQNLLEMCMENFTLQDRIASFINHGKTSYPSSEK